MRCFLMARASGPGALEQARIRGPQRSTPHLREVRPGGSARLQTRASTGSERLAAKPREFKREIEELEEIEEFMVTLRVRRRMNISKRLRRVRTHTISSISSASSISL
jgi:hypothetical protein